MFKEIDQKLITWIIVSLNTTLPEEVPEISFFCSFESFMKA